MIELTKQKQIRSKKIKDSARGEECTVLSTVCNYDNNTTVFAHANNHVSGKGVGLKSGDIFGCYACSDCHKWLDESNDSYKDKQLTMFYAMIRTQRKLIQKGLLVLK